MPHTSHGKVVLRQKISKVISGKRQCDPIHWIFAIETFVDPWQPTLTSGGHTTALILWLFVAQNIHWNFAVQKL